MDSIKVRCSECGEPCDLGENLEGAYALAEGWLYCPACNAAQGERLKVAEGLLDEDMVFFERIAKKLLHPESMVVASLKRVFTLNSFLHPPEAG
jgi:hypothetical protein